MTRQTHRQLFVYYKGLHAQMQQRANVSDLALATIWALAIRHATAAGYRITQATWEHKEA